MVLGRRFDAHAALELGVVSRVVPRAELAGATHALADEIASSSPVSTRLVKAAVRSALAAEEATGLAAEEEALAEAGASHDAAEGVQAFAEKRDPEWENR